MLINKATRRKERCLIKLKSAKGTQNVRSLMGKTRDLFSIAVGRYSNSAVNQRIKFFEAKMIWEQTALDIKIRLFTEVGF